MQELDFGACYVYSRGSGAVSVESQGHIGKLKRGDLSHMPAYAQEIARLVKREGEFDGFFGDDVVMVPVPGSAQLVKGGLWVPNRIAQQLKAAGLAREVAPLLRRAKAVNKSAFAVASERPNVQTHFDSFEADVVKPTPGKLLLVDDVITQGCTVLAAARRLKVAYPKTKVRAFADVSTNGQCEHRATAGAVRGHCQAAERSSRAPPIMRSKSSPVDLAAADLHL